MKPPDVSGKIQLAETALKSLPQSETPFGQMPILVVQNGDDETALMKSAFNEANISNPLHFVTRGEDAIAYLERITNSVDSPLTSPASMWLNVKLPRMDGFEVLAWTRRQARLNKMAVVVLSTEARTEEADRAYNLGADYFLRKPDLFDEWIDRIKNLQEWLLLCHHNRKLASLAKHPASKPDK